MVDSGGPVECDCMSALFHEANPAASSRARTSPTTNPGAPTELKGVHIRQMALAFTAASWVAILFAIA